jgi:multidrug resistance efflux pump
MEEDDFYKEVLEPLDRFKELEKQTKKIVQENKKLKEKNKKISDIWMKYFRKSIELNSEIFMDFKQELNKALEIEDKKIINQEILDREDREFKKIEQAIKKIEELESGLED